MEESMEKMKMEMGKMKMEKNLDFISELPDAVLHHILSSLDMIFVVRTSILSKRWRYLWRSIHFINFDEELFNTTTQFIITSEAAEPSSRYSLEKEKDDPFKDFVNQVLSLHCKSDINTFSISGVDPRVRKQTGLSRSKYNPWLAIRRDAEDSENRRTLDLPLCFFNSNTLTTLKLDMGSKRGRQIFKIPDLGSVDLPCLKTLHLRSVLLVDGDSIGGFFSMCLVLETLIISNCLLEERNNLSIYGLQLKNLELGISCVKSTCIGDNNGKVTVFAPNLESFLCRDLLLSEFYLDLENVSALLDAELDYCLSSSPDCLCRISLDYSPQREEEYVQNLLKCLRNVCNVKSLSLYMGLFKGPLEVPSSFQGLLNPFCNLRFLQLKTLFFKEHILNIAVLEMCPYLQTLILEWTSGPVARPLDKIYSKHVNKVDEIWEVKAPLHCLSHNLQFVEIRGVYGTLDEFKFVRFLMKNAMMLVKLIVVTSGVCESQPYFKGCLQTFLSLVNHFLSNSFHCQKKLY